MLNAQHKISLPLRKHSREHLFWDIQEQKICKLPVASISSCTNPVPVSEFNQYIDALKQDIRCQKIVDFEIDEETGIDWSKNSWLKNLNKNYYFSFYYTPKHVKKEDDIVHLYDCKLNNSYRDGSYHYNDSAGYFPNNSWFFEKDTEYNFQLNPSPKKNEDCLQLIQLIRFEQNNNFYGARTPIMRKICIGSQAPHVFALPADNDTYNTPGLTSEDKTKFIKNLKNRIRTIKIPQLYLIGELGARFPLLDNNPENLN